LNTNISRTNTFTFFALLLTSWLGKFARQPDSLPTKRLLSAWAPAARRGGAQFITLRTTYCATLGLVLGMKLESGYYLKEWLSLTQSTADWNHLGALFFKSNNKKNQLEFGLGTLAGPRICKISPPSLSICHPLGGHGKGDIFSWRALPDWRESWE
jgi:hypothetical protein